MKIDDATLLAYVDGELDAAARASVQAALAADPVLSERAARHQRLRRTIADAYRPVLEEPPSERLMSLISAGASPVTDLAAARARRRGGGAWVWGAMAACLVIGLAGGAGLARLASQPLLAAGASGLQARGQLRVALDSQLASGGNAGRIRIGLSFLSTGRAYCRTFQAAAAGVAGLACREPDGWRIQVAVAQPSQSHAAYRMAASDIPPAVLQAAQSIMADPPLDAAGEAAARAKGWRP